MQTDIKGALYQAVIDHARKNYDDVIENAYEYFFEEEYPEDFLSGPALELAFINFEDWLVCDFREEGEVSLIDAYIRDANPQAESIDALNAMRDSNISIYEVIGTGDAIRLKDILLDKEVITDDPALKGASTGDLFGARFISYDGQHHLGRCAYPFGKTLKQMVLDAFESQYNRYIKHKNPSGSKELFLKEESYSINIIWLSTVVMKRESAN